MPTRYAKRVLSFLVLFTATARAFAAEDEAAAQEAEIRKFVDRYFTSWSKKDMDRYGECFIPQASVQLVDPRQGLLTLPLSAFLKGQRESQLDPKHHMTETPEKVDVRMEGELARVLVYWKLVDGEQATYGYDHFTLMPYGGRWRIAHLIFYSVPPPKGK